MVEVGLQLISNSVTDPSVINMIASWRKQYDELVVRERRRVSIIEAVGEGYDTVIEIASHTGYSDSTVRRELAKLVRLRKLIQTTVKVRGVRRGGYEYRFSLAL